MALSGLISHIQPVEHQEGGVGEDRGFRLRVGPGETVVRQVDVIGLVVQGADEAVGRAADDSDQAGLRGCPAHVHQPVLRPVIEAGDAVLSGNQCHGHIVPA